MTMDKRRQMVYSVLVCPDCDFKYTIPRRRHRKRGHLHIKDMWCPLCKTEKKFVEHKDTDFIAV